MKRAFIVLLCITAVLPLVSCRGKMNVPAETTAVTQGAAESPEITADTAALSSANYSYTYAEMQYALNYTYSSLMSQYYSTYASYGLNYQSDLKQQYYDESQGTTWFDFFVNQTVVDVQKKLLYCEAAKEAGTVLSDEDKSDIDSIIESWRTTAASDENYANLDEYLSVRFGNIVTEASIRSYLEKEMLAYRYYSDYMSEIKYTDEDYETFYSENTKQLQKVDCVRITFVTDTETGVTAEQAKKSAEEAFALSSPEAFLEYVTDYIINVVNGGDETKISADVIAQNIKEQGITYADDDLTNWCFDSARKRGDTYILSDDEKGQYSVYMIDNPPARGDYQLVNYRHIYLPYDAYGSAEATKAKADELLQQWRDNGSSVEYFSSLVEKYSNDTSSVSNGGLYSNVDKTSSMDALYTWIFDEGRKSGDATVLSTSSAYHVVYFDSYSTEAWKYYCDAAMRSNVENEKLTQYSSVYQLSTNSDVVSSLTIIQ